MSQSADGVLTPSLSQRLQSGRGSAFGNRNRASRCRQPRRDLGSRGLRECHAFSRAMVHSAPRVRRVSCRSRTETPRPVSLVSMLEIPIGTRHAMLGHGASARPASICSCMHLAAIFPSAVLDFAAYRSAIAAARLGVLEMRCLVVGPAGKMLLAIANRSFGFRREFIVRQLLESRRTNELEHCYRRPCATRSSGSTQVTWLVCSFDPMLSKSPWAALTARAISA